MFNSELLRSFLTNWLEPLSYLIATVAIFSAATLKRSSKLTVLSIGYLISTLLMVIASSTVSIRVNNILLYDIKLLIINYTLSYYFFKTLRGKHRKVLFVIPIMGTLFFLVRDILLQQTGAFDSLGYPIFSFFVLAGVFSYYRELLRFIPFEPVLLSLDFWIINSMLIYYLSSGIIFLTIYVLTPKVHNLQDAYIVTDFWAGHNIVLFLSSICLITGVIWIYREK